MHGGVCKLEAGPVRLFHYPPGLREEPHEHGPGSVSILLLGSFADRTGCEELILDPGRIGLRAPGMRHAVDYGPGGAAILSIPLPRGLSVTHRSGTHWQDPLGAGERRRLIAAISSGNGEELEEAVVDLVSARDKGEAKTAGSVAPLWLRRARERILDEPALASIQGLAREIGVSRIYFSRLFARHYHVPPSLFRRRAMASRAAALMSAHNYAAADAAAAAGFCDQSHMLRALKESCGMTARELLGSGRKFTSVQ